MSFSQVRGSLGVPAVNAEAVSCQIFPLCQDRALSSHLKLLGPCLEAPQQAGQRRDSLPSASSGQHVAWFLPASCSLGSANSNTDRLPGGRPGSAKDKGPCRGTWGQKADSQLSRCLLLALAPGFREEHGLSFPTLLLPSPWDHSPPPLFKGPAAVDTGHSNVQRSTSMLSPGPHAKPPFRDQDHSSGCLGRMWQVAIWQPLSVGSQSLCQVSTLHSSCPPSTRS